MLTAEPGQDFSGDCDARDDPLRACKPCDEAAGSTAMPEQEPVE